MLYYMWQKATTVEVKSQAGAVPITVDEYADLKQTLKESEMRMQQLLHSNTRLGEEVALLQNMASCWGIFIITYGELIHSVSWAF